MHEARHLTDEGGHGDRGACHELGGTKRSTEDESLYLLQLYILRLYNLINI